MSTGGGRYWVKQALGGLPFTSELAQWLRPGNQYPTSGYNLDRLAAVLPEWVQAAQSSRCTFEVKKPRRILIVAFLRWWLEYGCALGLLLSGLGHHVDLGFVPYRNWVDPVHKFDSRRQAAYIRRVLAAARDLMTAYDLSAGPMDKLPEALLQQIEKLSKIDVQYTRQRETLYLDTDGKDGDLYKLRLSRNMAAAGATRRLLERGEYDVVIIPNGSIFEFGASYRAARDLGVPVVTYEFGEQRERVWLAQNAEIMLQDTSAFWEARGQTSLSAEERKILKELYRARRSGHVWANFGRRWQHSQRQGTNSARESLSLDPSRQVVLLCTNVVGDSLALGRQIFTEGMVDWLSMTVKYFSERPDVQLIVRVHPGELNGAGDPSVDIIRRTLPELPENIIVVPPESQINTYDLVSLANLGLVYTTTVGMEMAMAGIPVIVGGWTHYRGKGFTCDPTTQEEYYGMLNQFLATTHVRPLKHSQVELAERYAYRFFFEYPLPFPWHLVDFWKDVAARPIAIALQPDKLTRYQRAMDAFLRIPLEWDQEAMNKNEEQS